jgi:hypothetical protein
VELAENDRIGHYKTLKFKQKDVAEILLNRKTQFYLPFTTFLALILASKMFNSKPIMSVPLHRK